MIENYNNVKGNVNDLHFVYNYIIHIIILTEVKYEKYI